MKFKKVNISLGSWKIFEIRTLVRFFLLTEILHGHLEWKIGAASLATHTNSICMLFSLADWFCFDHWPQCVHTEQ